MTKPKEPVMQMKGVKLKLGGRAILNGVNLTLQQEDCLVIMGESGSGKSTLLRLLLGILQVQAGSIYIQDQELTTLSRRELNVLRSRIGMVYQNAALISSLSVAENVALPLRELSSKKPREIATIVDEKLKMVGLKEAKEKFPEQLSGGMKKRVGLARALVLEPTLILFDEPTAGLDPLNCVVINELILNMRKEHHVASIIVTHDIKSAFAVATRAAMLHNGKIIEEGSVHHFRHSTNPFVSRFLMAATKPISAQDLHHAHSQK